ncbi:endonuclease NucS domain-containing protein [Yonghaparkia sp. Root332]|uniref:endonuclease NucS domain-containing protein n=1 Tax=Yonghaparkia sp. Root332 TaxID=1736516 RepID=UPI000700A016|nr:endonuclease NucS domain-containing protein [Yonghaparkia sp. Root332]KQV24813.1 hypothetical protein ASC54_09960 [Yonghaparkia sp. Root332]
MPRRFLVERAGERFDLVESPAASEHHLQEVMKMNPQLIPADDLGLDGDLLVIGRETSLASGSIDLLCLASSGDVVLVELKTGPQNPDFRHALAQLIDYGSDLWRLSVDDFDRGVVQRFLRSGHAPERLAGSHDLRDAISRAGWALDSEATDALLERLADVLQSGDFHFVVAAQRFTETMRTSLEYMNATMRSGRFFLVEIVQLAGAELTAHAAQVVASPSRRTAATSRSQTTTDEVAFLASINDDQYRDAFRDFLAGCISLGLALAWGSKGLSIRMQTPDQNLPISIAWGLPETTSWQGLKYLSVGIDRTSLARTPSVAQAAERYLAAIGAIPGGRTANSKISARSFDAATAPAAVPALIEAIEALVEEVQALS